MILKSGRNLRNRMNKIVSISNMQQSTMCKLLSIVLMLRLFRPYYNRVVINTFEMKHFFRSKPRIFIIVFSNQPTFGPFTDAMVTAHYTK